MSFEFCFYTIKKVAFKLIITVTGPYEITETGNELVGGEIYSLSALLTIKDIHGEPIRDAVTITCLGEEAKYVVIDGTSLKFAHLTQDTVFEFEITIAGYTFERSFVVKQSFETDTIYTYKDSRMMYGGNEYEFNIENVEEELPSIKEDSPFEYRAFVEGSFVKTWRIRPNNVGEEQVVSLTMTIGYFSASTEEELFRFTLIYNYTVLPNVDVKINYPKPNDVELEDKKEYLSDGVEIENFFGTPADFNTENRVVMTAISDEEGNFVVEESECSWEIRVNANNINNLELGYGDGLILTNSGSGEVVLAENTGENAPMLNLTFTLVDKSKNGSIDFIVRVNGVEKIYQVVVLIGKVVDLKLNSPNYVASKEQFYAEDLKKQDDVKIFSKNRILKYAFSQTGATGGKYYVRLIKKSGESVVDVQTVSIVADSIETKIQDLQKSYADYIYDGTYGTEALAKTGGERLDTMLFSMIPQLTSRIVAVYKTLTNDIEINLEKANFVIKLQKQVRGSDGWENSGAIALADNVEIKAEDRTQEVQYVPTLYKVGEEEEEISISNYNYGIEILLKFSMKYNSDALGPNGDMKKIELKAQKNKFYSFLDTYAEELGILDENGDVMTQSRMQEIGAKFDIQIYGASIALAQNAGSTATEKALTNSALSVHNRLRTSENTTALGAKYRYTTGLIPRAKCTLNEDGFIEGSDDTYTNRLNYITLTAVSDGSDWTISAQGSNNNGNHVMLRIDYVVELGDGNVVRESHNLLFLVQPNTTLTFATDTESETNSAITAQEYEDDGAGQLISSNRANPYTVDFNMVNVEKYEMNLFGRNNYIAVMNVLLHGSTENSMRNLTYKYRNTSVELAGKTYNDKPAGSADVTDGRNNTLVFESSSWSANDDGFTSNSTSNAVIQIKQFEFGNANFYLEFEDEFEFKMRFYFIVVSRVNPILSAQVSEIKEGESLEFGARYTTLRQDYDAEGYMKVGSFDYEVKMDSNVSDSFIYKDTITAKNNNYISVENNTGTGLTVRIVVITEKGESFTKTFGEEAKLSNGGNGIYKVFPSESNGNWFGDNVANPERESIKTVEVYLKCDEGTDRLGTYTVEYGNALKEGTSVRYEEGKIENSSFKEKGFLTGLTKKSRPTKYNQQGSPYEYEDYFTIGDAESSPEFYLYDETIQNHGNSLVPSEGAQGKSKEYTRVKPVLSNYYKNTVSEPEKINGEKLSYVYLSGMDIVGFHLKNQDDKSVETYAINEQNLAQSSNIANSSTDINDLTITKITIVANGKQIYASDSLSLKFVTSSNFAYHQRGSTSTSISYGYGLDSRTGTEFTIPELSGDVWGVENEMNVTFNITLSKSGNSTTLPLFYTLKRKDFDENIFASTNLIDGEYATKNHGTIYNDTLEVRLEKGESVDLVLYDKELYAFENEDKSEMIYVRKVASAASKEATKVYYRKSGNTFTVVADWTSADNIYERFTPSIISLSNKRSYVTREYVGITKNMMENGAEHITKGQFYILALNHIVNDVESASGTIENLIEYNGGAISLARVMSNGKIAYTANSTIVDYTNSIDLHINHVEELGGRDHKTTKLYFLYQDSGKLYRYEQPFDIYPLYASATTSLSDNSIDVADYIEVSRDASRKYYIIPISSWGKDVTLKCNSVFTSRNGNFSTNDLYKFKFEVSKISSQGYGQANIDARGLITTVEGFSLDTQTITIHVYMKVSGDNGLFESDETSSTPIGTFVLHFRTSSTTIGTSNSTGIYKIDDSVFAVPTGYAYAYTNSSYNPTSANPISTSGLEGKAFTCNIGEELNFSKLFDSTLKSYNNKKYKLLKDGNNAVVFNSSNALFSEGTWRFDSVGERTITIGISAKSSGQVVGYFTVKVLVCDTEQESLDFALEKGSAFDLSQIDSTEGLTWYKKGTQNSLTTLSSGQDTISGDNKFANVIYINSLSQKIKTYNVSLYIYSTVNKRFIAVQTDGVFAVESLVSKESGLSYEFWELSGNKLSKRVRSVTFSGKSVGDVETRNFVMIVRDSRQEVKDVQKFEISFKFVSKSFSGEYTENVTLGEDRTLFAETVKDTVLKCLELSSSLELISDYESEFEAIKNSTTFLSIQVQENSGALQYLTDVVIPANMNSVPRTYIVTYRTSASEQNVTIKTIRIVFNFSGEGV